MQTISLPYSCSEEGADFLKGIRRVYSAAVRTAYANATSEAGVALKQKDLRDLVKGRFAGGIADAWILHCATLEGMDLRKARPDGKMVFGTRTGFERRSKGLIDRQKWRMMRIRPLCSRGDKTKGNRHFRLSADTKTCKFRMYGREIELSLPQMTGNTGETLRQAAELAASKKINITFRLDDKKLHVTIDPQDLPNHPQRRRPVRALPRRSLGIDLNPNWIGVAAVENTVDPASLAETRLLEHALVKLDLAVDASPELVRETLAAVADRAISLARKHRCGVICLEKGLGKLRSSGKNRSLNRLLNYWARTIFVAMLTRRARLAGIEVLEVWGGYSSTIGNLAFDAPDACASAAEIARRGIARLARLKDVLPVFGEGWEASLRKDLPLPVEARCWADVHRSIKAAKLGYRRPHPDVPPGTRVSDVHGMISRGHAVVRLRKRHRPGLMFRLVVVKSDEIIRTLRLQRGRAEQQAHPTPKSG